MLNMSRKETQDEVRKILEKLYWHDRGMAISEKRTNEAYNQTLSQLNEVYEPRVDKEKIAEIIWDEIQLALSKNVLHSEEIEDILAERNVDKKSAYAIAQRKEEWLK